MEEKLNKYEHFLEQIKKFPATTVREYLAPVIYIYNAYGEDITKITSAEVMTTLIETVANMRGWSSNTRYKYATAIHEFFKFCMLIGATEVNPLPINPFKKPKEKEAEFFSEEEKDEIVYDPHLSIRDFTIMMVLSDTAVRRQELIRMDLADLDTENRQIHIKGKGDKNRWVTYTKKTKAILDFYLECLKKQGYEGPPLFPSRKMGKGEGGRISKSEINKKMQRISKRKNIRIHPHKFRHSRGGELIKKGVHQTMVQRLLGHSSMRMTSKYVHYKPKDLVEAIDSIEPKSA